MCYWFKGESLESCLQMTKRQLMGLYIETHRVEAREQLRLVLSVLFGNPQVKGTEEYIEGLQNQANPPSYEEAESLGISGFKRAASLFGSSVKSDVGKHIAGRVKRA